MRRALFAARQRDAGSARRRRVRLRPRCPQGGALLLEKKGLITTPGSQDRGIEGSKGRRDRRIEGSKGRRDRRIEGSKGRGDRGTEGTKGRTHWKGKFTKDLTRTGPLARRIPFLDHSLFDSLFKFPFWVELLNSLVWLHSNALFQFSFHNSIFVSLIDFLVISLLTFPFKSLFKFSF